MKTYVVLCMVIFAVRAARLLPSQLELILRTSAVQCHSCQNAVSEEACNAAGSVTNCSPGAHCMTHIVTDEHGVSTVDKGCQHATLCAREQEHFADYCTAVGKAQTTCHFCCDQTMCNSALPQPKNNQPDVRDGSTHGGTSGSTGTGSTGGGTGSTHGGTGSTHGGTGSTHGGTGSTGGGTGSTGGGTGSTGGGTGSTGGGTGSTGSAATTTTTKPTTTTTKPTTTTTKPTTTTTKPTTTTTAAPTRPPYENPCKPDNPCQNGGVCFPRPLHGDYVCRCPPGYYGRHCDGDYCDPNPCLNGGECLGDDGGFGCRCPEGYEGEYCEIDTNPCEPNPCNNGVCYSWGGRVFCRCDDGYEGPYCDKEIVDPCDPSPCVHGACHASGDSFTCDCEEGWEGQYCDSEIVNPCDPSPCVHGECHPNGDSFSCECDEGWEGQYCDSETPSGGYDCDENNPCDSANTSVNGYYYPHHDEEYFVQCDAFGGCWVMPCGPGTVWSQEAYTCVHD